MDRIEVELFWYSIDLAPTQLSHVPTVAKEQPSRAAQYVPVYAHCHYTTESSSQMAFAMITNYNEPEAMAAALVHHTGRWAGMTSPTLFFVTPSPWEMRIPPPSLWLQGGGKIAREGERAERTKSKDYDERH